MSLARWIMDRATANPPRGREDWARAMRAEFDALEAGRLSWALGCWRTMAGWRLQADWLFLLGLIGVPMVFRVLVWPALFMTLAVTAPEGWLRDNAYAVWFGELAIVAGLLAAWRPDHRVKAALAAAIVPAIASYIALMQMNQGAPFEEWVVFDSPPIVGYLAILCACWMGASAGARVARHSRRFFSAT